jgi:hypothetical protein
VIEWHGLQIRSQERRAWRRARARRRCQGDAAHPLYDVAGILGCDEDVVRRTYGHHAQDHLRGRRSLLATPPVTPLIAGRIGPNRPQMDACGH